MQEDQNQELMDQEGTEAFAAGFDDEPGKPAEQTEQELDQVFILADPEKQVYRCKYCEEKYTGK